jgi:hypothetical protein
MPDFLTLFLLIINLRVKGLKELEAYIMTLSLPKRIEAECA